MGKNSKSRDMRKNGSGIYDPTAYKAIKKVDNERGSASAKTRYQCAISDIFTVCEEYGFHLENRVMLKDKKTGKIWR